MSLCTILASIPVSRLMGGPGLVCCPVTQGGWKQLLRWWSQHKSRSLSQHIPSDVWNPGCGSVHTRWSCGPITWTAAWHKQVGAAAVCHITPWGARQSHQMGCSSHSHRGGIILPAWPIRTDWNLLYTGKQNKSQQVITKLSREKSLPHTTYGNWFTSVWIKLTNKIYLYLHSLLKILHNALQSLFSSQEEFVLSKL